MTDSLLEKLKKQQEANKKKQQEPEKTPTKTESKSSNKSAIQDLIDKAKKSVANKIALAQLIKPDMFVDRYYDWYGKQLTKPRDVLQTLADKGYVPQFKDKNIAGLYEEGASFLPKKIMSAFMAFPRATSTAMVSNVKSLPDILEKSKGGNIGTLLTESAKASPQIFRNAIGAFFNKPGQYQDYDWEKAYRELLPNTKFTQQFEWAKNTDDWKRGTNWLQKIASPMFGRPSDIAGLVSDIVFDPLTYVSGGVGKGAKTGIRITEDFVDNAGRKILSKGSMVAVSKEGRQIVNNAVTEIVPQLIETIGKSSITNPLSKELIRKWFPNFISKVKFKNTSIGKTLIQNLAKAGRTIPDDILKKSSDIIDPAQVTKLLKEMPIDSLRELLTSRVIEGTLRETIKSKPYGKAIALLDRGGLRLAGQTVISGETLGKAQSKIVPWLERLPGVKNLEQVFWTGKDIPEELRYAKQYLESFTKNKNREFIETAADVLKPLRNKLGKPNKAERKTVQNALEILKDISRYSEDLKSATGKKLEFYQNQIPKLQEAFDKLNLSDKLTKVIDNYQASISKPLADFEKRWGVQAEKIIEPYYIPVRKSTKSNVLLDDFKKLFRSVLGNEEAAYQRPIKSDYLQRQEQIARGTLKAEDLAGLEEATFKRIFESTQQVGRSRYLNDIKQFGVIGDKEGWIRATDKSGKVIKGMEGWSFPKEIAKPLQNMQALFFTDEGFKGLVKGYDKLLTFWKRSALATPGYHIRNLMSDTWSGVMEYGLEFLNPVYWVDAQKISSADKWAGARNFQLRSIKATAGEIADEFADSGVRKATQYQTEAMLHGKARLIDLLSFHETSTRVGSWREDLGRTVAGLIEKRNGQISPKMVASNVKKVFFDYSDLTPTETEVFRRFVAPFYTWAKKNTVRQFELLATRLGKYSTIPKAKNFLENVTDKSELYDEVKPDYYDESGIWTIPAKDREGNQLGWSADLPFKDILAPSIMDLWDKANPLAKYLVERKTGVSTFTGAEYNWGELNEAPKFVQGMDKLPDNILSKIGLVKGEGGKVYITERMQHNLQSALPLYYTLSRLLPEQDKYNTWSQRLSTLGGQKFYPFKEDEATQYYYSGFNQKIEDVFNELEKLQYGVDEKGKALQNYPNVTESTPYARNLVKEKIGEEQYKTTGAKDMGLAELMAVLKKYGIEITMQDIINYLQEKEKNKE